MKRSFSRSFFFSLLNQQFREFGKNCKASIDDIISPWTNSYMIKKYHPSELHRVPWRDCSREEKFFSLLNQQFRDLVKIVKLRSMILHHFGLIRTWLKKYHVSTRVESINNLLSLSLILHPSIVETNIHTHGKFFKLIRASPQGGQRGTYLSPCAKNPCSVSSRRLEGKTREDPRVSEAHCFPLDEARTRTRARPRTRPTRGQYFTAYCCHLHTQPRDRMHDVGETRAFIYLLFICQRARYRTGPAGAHDPAGDRFEKLLIVPFLEGARHRDAHSFLSHRWGITGLLPPRANRTPSRLAIERLPRGGANRWVETPRMSRDRESGNQDGDRYDTRIIIKCASNLLARIKNWKLNTKWKRIFDPTNFKNINFNSSRNKNTNRRKFHRLQNNFWIKNANPFPTLSETRLVDSNDLCIPTQKRKSYELGGWPNFLLESALRDPRS